MKLSSNIRNYQHGKFQLHINGIDIEAWPCTTDLETAHSRLVRSDQPYGVSRCISCKHDNHRFSQYRSVASMKKIRSGTLPVLDQCTMFCT